MSREKPDAAPAGPAASVAPARPDSLIPAEPDGREVDPLPQLLGVVQVPSREPHHLIPQRAQLVLPALLSHQHLCVTTAVPDVSVVSSSRKSTPATCRVPSMIAT